jgi:hypothetical protein
MRSSLGAADNESFAVVASERRVEGWSSQRLPFEPKDQLLKFRVALRAALASIRAGGSLGAVYTSPVTSVCDVENILFYNVGLTAFARLIDRGVQFRRVIAETPPSPGGRSFAHHQLYETIDHLPAQVGGRTLAVCHQ